MQYKVIIVVLVLSLLGIPATLAQTTCSSSGTLEEFTTAFSNDTKAAITIHWIDPDCVEQEGSPIPVGEVLEFTTYDGHEFVFRDAEGNALLNYTVTTVIANEVVSLSEIIAAGADASATPEPVTCSAVEGAEHFATTFLNDTGSDLTLHFIDYVCVEKQGELIRAGEEFPFQTDDGDEFVFRDADGAAVLNYTVTPVIADQIVPLSELIAAQQEQAPEAVDSIVTLTGNLLEAVERDSYSFEGEADVQYVISLTSSEFDTYLQLSDASGTEVAADDDGGDELNSLIVFTAPEDGVYTVGIDSYAGEASGNYILSISHPTSVISGFLAAESPSDNPIDVEEDVTYFVFVSSDEFDTVLSILDESDVEVAVNDDREDGSTNSLIVFAASSTGSYTVRVTGYDSSNTGRFDILLGSFEKPE